MKPHRWILVAAAATPLCALALAATVSAEETPAGFARWESAIAAFEASDRRSPPPRDGILFVGSSSIRKWDLGKSFPDLPVINRGFGGSEIADSVHFFDRLITPHRPRIVLLYAGDNDMARGKTPEQVLADYRKFAARLREALPETRLAFICIKPSAARWKLWPKMREANALIRVEAEGDPLQTYLDIATPMLNGEGELREGMFLKDGLHLNDAGYQIWAKQIAPLLEKPPRR